MMTNYKSTDAFLIFIVAEISFEKKQLSPLCSQVSLVGKKMAELLEFGEWSLCPSVRPSIRLQTRDF